MSINSTLNIDKYDFQKNDARVLDLSDIVTKEELHKRLKVFFKFPDYYGGNLDALHDCLTDISEETSVTIILPEKWPEKKSKYIKNFIKVCGDAASENEKLTFLFSYPA
ncbi:MAG TPA: barstar [Lachnospiraceae bacterium]|nr:barstar [Lachnospiraceae bacterium]